MNGENSLALCMIVKNEEKNLQRCLDSVFGFVDEIVIVDTGSSDNTIEIAKGYNAKIYNYTWNNDFSAARNFAISHVTKTWILLLDADEVFEVKDTDKLMRFLENKDYDGAHFIMNNYMGGQISENITMHNALRLLRNNDQYHYEGEIHEQIKNKNKENIAHKFPLTDIAVHHYGYLDQEVEEKQKRNRNIPILEKQIQRTPNDPFVLFNLGNEYLAKKVYQKAIELYLLAAKFMNINEAYVPHLILRLANCYDQLDDFDKAIYYYDFGLTIYPKCTDYVYMKGCLYTKKEKFMLAISAFEKCLEMGEPPIALTFINDCGGYRPAVALGDIYRELENYEKSLYYYNQALRYDVNKYNLLYKIGKVINKQYLDKENVYNQLYSYFSDRNYEPNRILIQDIFINESLYDLVLKEEVPKKSPYRIELLFLRAKALFYKTDYLLAKKAFKQVLKELELDQSYILQNINRDGHIFYHLIEIIQDTKNMEIYSQIEASLGSTWRDAYLLFSDESTVDIKKEVGDVVLILFNIFLKLKNDTFIQAIIALYENFIIYNQKRLFVKLLYDNGYREKAVEYGFKLTKEVETLDKSLITILYKSM